MNEDLVLTTILTRMRDTGHMYLYVHLCMKVQECKPVDKETNNS